MGELHLEIYVERIRREYNVDVEVGRPKVSYREAPTVPTRFDFKHRKQTGGAGQYAHIIGSLTPLPENAEEPFEFEEQVVGGRIPTAYIPSVEKGFRSALPQGPLAGFPIIGVKATLEDGSYHEVDSSDLAFQICARNGFRESFLKMKPVLLEPVMRLEVECPTEFQGTVTGDLVSRRGVVLGTENPTGQVAVITAEVPLAESFGYSTELRSQTQGRGSFTMELARYRRVPAKLQEEIIAERKKAELVKA
jgi:elongation factor G